MTRVVIKKISTLSAFRVIVKKRLKVLGVYDSAPEDLTTVLNQLESYEILFFYHVLKFAKLERL